jgi:hypothetical protein
MQATSKVSATTFTILMFVFFSLLLNGWAKRRRRLSADAGV